MGTITMEIDLAKAGFSTGLLLGITEVGCHRPMGGGRDAPAMIHAVSSSPTPAPPNIIAPVVEAATYRASATMNKGTTRICTRFI